MKLSDIPDRFEPSMISTLPYFKLENHEIVELIWGPKTTINQLSNALDKYKAWKKAKEENASTETIIKLEVSLTSEEPVPEHLRASSATLKLAKPSALETPLEGLPSLTLPRTEVPPSKASSIAGMKLPKSKLKLKI